MVQLLETLLPELTGIGVAAGAISPIRPNVSWAMDTNGLLHDYFPRA